MELLIGILNVFAIVAIVLYWYQHLPKSPVSKFFFPALSIKIVAGLVLGLVYKLHYAGGDTIFYFQDAAVLADLAYEAPLDYLKSWTGITTQYLRYADQPRALVIVKLISLAAILTYKNYWLSSIYFSLFSFFGMWKLTSVLVSQKQAFKNPAIIAFLFYPSVVFWSSGLLKESIAMGCISLCIAIYIPYMLEQKSIATKYIILSLLLLFLIWQLKFYYGAVFIPLLLVGIIISYLKNLSPKFRSNIWMQLIATVLLPLIVYFPLSFINPILNFQNLLSEIVKNHDLYFSNGNLPEAGYIHFSHLRPIFLSIIENFPLSLFSGLFRPLVFEVNTLFQTIAGLENTILFLAFAAGLLNLFKLKKSRFLYLFFITSLYIAILAAFLSLSTPNFGTLMRYKVAFLPFLVFLVLINNPLLSLWAKKS